MQREMIGILMALLSREKVKAGDLAREFEISVRSVYRYVDKLSQIGLPIYAEAGRYGGISMLDSYKLHSNYLTKEEMDRLLVCLDSFSLQDGTTKSAKDKILTLSNSRADCMLKSHQLLVHTQLSGEQQEAISVLQTCIAQNIVAKINYSDDKGVQTFRDVEPYALLLKDNLWYAYCYCRLRQDFRFFKISRIISVVATREIFKERQHNVDPNQIGSNLDKVPRTKVKLLVENKASTHVAEWLGLQNLTKTEDGLIAVAEMPFDDYLVHKIMSFGKDVTVLSPRSLKERVVKEAKSLLLNYK
ncbi:MAG: YafY family transcriptional regulator [Clostridia bacterium]|nr:YafY family transcriptional regulator [Clostridia bacterium]